MRWLIFVAACSGPATSAPPVVGNTGVDPPAVANVVTCGSFDSSVRCFPTTAACEIELQNCRDVKAPRWTCSRSTSTGMVHGTIDLCLPSEELCRAGPGTAEIQREPCRHVPEVYCRGGSELVCHPTREICEQEVKTSISFGGEPSTCTRYR